MDPRVSVIIPSYNHAQFVGEAIRSVLNQSYSSIEVLVTDDASQDGSVDVIRAVKDPRVRLEVFPSNRGLSLAMNAAIERAHGEFISVLDSDDYLLPDTIVKQVDFLEKNPHVSAVFGMPKLIDERGIPLNSGYGEFTPPFVGCSPSRQFWLRQFFFHGNCLCHTTVMIRRSVHDEVGLYDPRLWNLQDFDLWVRLCVRHDICVMQDELTARRIRDNNLNLSAPRRDTVLRSMFETFEILKHYRSMAPELIREVFARDLTNIDSNLPASILLGELALTANPAAHRLFGLETLFQEAKNGFDARGLFKLTGCVDAFNIGRCLDTELLHQEARDRLVAEESLHAEQRHRLKMELSQQVEERERLQSELLQQAQERGSLQEELSQRAREYEQLRADLARQAEERERLQADRAEQA